MLAKICGVDLHPDRFAPLRVAQTQAVRRSTVVIRDHGEQLTAWHLLLESAAGEYAWDCLLDATAEFVGRPAGHAASGSPGNVGKALSVVGPGTGADAAVPAPGSLPTGAIRHPLFWRGLTDGSAEAARQRPLSSQARAERARAW